MADCLTNEQIEQYSHGTLGSPETWVAAEVHLAGCTNCSERLDAILRKGCVPVVQRLLPKIGQEACLDDDLLRRFVSGEADEREEEQVEFHIQDCPLCAEDVTAIRTFQAKMRRYDWMEASRAAQHSTIRDSWYDRALDRIPLKLRHPVLLRAGRTLAFLVVPLLLFQLYSEIGSLKSQWKTEQRTLAGELSQKEMRITGLQQEIKRLQSASQATQRRLTNVTQQMIKLKEKTGSAEALDVAIEDAGKQVEVDRQGNIVGLEGASLQTQEDVKRALQQQIVMADIQDSDRLIGPTLGLRSGPEKGKTFSLRQPVRTVVQSDRPTFRWTPMPGATSYAVSVIDDSRNKNVVISPSLKETTWTSSTPLTPGHVYRWIVVATLSDGTTLQAPPPSSGKDTPKARFRVLDPKAAGALAAEIQPSGASHLVRSVLYAHAGLLDDAEQELNALAADNPTSITIRNLRDSVLALRKPSNRP